jgi:hypothetical protein
LKLNGFKKLTSAEPICIYFTLKTAPVASNNGQFTISLIDETSGSSTMASCTVGNLDISATGTTKQVSGFIFS